MNIFAKMKVHFDAIYSNLTKLTWEEAQFTSYKDIYDDFKVYQEEEDIIDHNVLLVLPLCLENDEIRDKLEGNFLFESKNKLNMSGLPVPDERTIVEAEG